MAKKKNHYVDNEKLLEEILLYKEEVKQAKERGEEKRPQMNNYLGGAIFEIANRFSRRPNFINYTYRDDMVEDAVENCIRYICNFDPEKSRNPFAYITQISYYAFLRRINKEKKQAMIRAKCMEEAAAHGMFDPKNHKNFKGEVDPQKAFMEHMHISISDYEAHLEEKKKKAEKEKKKKNPDGPSLEDYMEKE